MKADKMSMAHGLEVRTPFLDSKLIEYFSGIDNKYKKQRFIFRKVVKNLLPREIMIRKKQGFTLPLSNWFGNQKFIDRIIPHLEDLKKRMILDPVELEKIIKNPLEFKNDHRIWVLLNLEIWCKLYTDKIPLKEVKV